jgi:hypothetical protein
VLFLINDDRLTGLADDLVLEALNQLMVALGVYSAMRDLEFEDDFDINNFSWQHQETAEGYTDGYCELSVQVVDADVMISILQHTPDAIAKDL